MSHQIVAAAIAQSIGQTEIVTITRTEIGIAGLTRESVCRALREECEGEADGDVSEFWGVNVHGDTWRVCVEV